MSAQFSQALAISGRGAGGALIYFEPEGGTWPDSQTLEVSKGQVEVHLSLYLLAGHDGPTLQVGQYDHSAQALGVVEAFATDADGTLTGWQRSRQDEDISLRLFHVDDQHVCGTVSSTVPDFQLQGAFNASVHR